MIPEAVFDVADLLVREGSTQGLHESEIHSLCYLGQLVGLLCGIAPEHWGYDFARHKLGGPYATDVSEALAILEARGMVKQEATPTGRWFSATAQTKSLAARLADQSCFRERARVLEIVLELAALKSLPFVTTSVQEEPQLKSSAAIRGLLGVPGVALQVLQDQFAAVTETLGEHGQDPWLKAALWLEYLNATRKSDPAHGS